MNQPLASSASDGLAKPGPRSHAFGRSLNHVKPFMAAALENFTLIAPFLLVAAIVLSVLAVVQVSSFVAAFTHDSKATAANTIAPLIEKKPLGPADYQSAANVIAKNNSAVVVELSRDRSAILLSVREPALLPEFIYALVTIQSYRAGVAWNATRLCLAKCDGNVAASAEITGYTQAISFAGLNEK